MTEPSLLKKLHQEKKCLNCSKPLKTRQKIYCSVECRIFADSQALANFEIENLNGLEKWLNP